MISIDSRQVNTGDWFIPVKGPNFDGHNFIQDVIAKGARVLDVDLTQYATDFRKNRMKAQVIGVTGSAGKTSVKDLLAAVLGSQFKVHKTAENQNNEIGVPLTLINTPDEADFVVVEMGMRGRGQIKHLAHIARPNFVLISSIGSTHIELLKTRRNIALAKAEIFDFPTDKSHDYNTILNTEMNYFDLVKERAERHGFSVAIITEPDPIQSNIKLVTELARQVGVNEVNIKTALSQYSSQSAHRQQRIEWGNSTLIDDTYNANPESMRFAIEKLIKDFPDQPLGVVLGEMRELGDHAEKAHADLVNYVQKQPRIQRVSWIGPMYKAFVKNGHDWYDINDKNKVTEALKTQREDGYAILVKGSRSLQMETIIQQL
jgi:UDP-N-acetylmuramoyl-tripeptide--D-alanyl-D-alanine ligase